MSNLTLRLLTAIIGGPLVLGMIVYSWWTTAVLVGVALLLAAVEYYQIVSKETSTGSIDLGFGILYLGLPLLSALWLRAQDDGEIWFLLLLAANWITDIAAYVVGRAVGKTPFAPRISPKKTWEGTIGGVVGGFVAPLLVAVALDFTIIIAIVIVALLVPIATVLGDLLESRLKRRFQVKDSGQILPGHGGILDRIDGTLVALPVVAVIVTLIG